MLPQQHHVCRAGLRSQTAACDGWLIAWQSSILDRWNSNLLRGLKPQREPWRCYGHAAGLESPSGARILHRAVRNAHPIAAFVDVLLLVRPHVVVPQHPTDVGAPGHRFHSLRGSLAAATAPAMLHRTQPLPCFRRRQAGT